MTLRKATPQDIDTLVNLGHQLHLVEKDFEPLLTFSIDEAKKRYASEIENTFSLIVLAEEGDEAIGYLYAHADLVDYLDTTSRECEIEVIYVLPKYRGHGIARELIQECFEWSKDKDIFRFKTGIYAKNLSSEKAFSKIGFTPYHSTYCLAVKK